MPKKRFTAVLTLSSTSASVLPSNSPNRLRVLVGAVAARWAVPLQASVLKVSNTGPTHPRRLRLLSVCCTTASAPDENLAPSFEPLARSCNRKLRNEGGRAASDGAGGR